MKFSEDFIWGTASASYQIEGAWNEDGKGESIWDAFSHTPGNTFGDHTGDVACDAYHRFEEDLDLMASLGIKAYRLSISWPRIIPDGDGEVNPLGLEYYDRVIDGCIARGIEPWVTLYHWDLPLALDKKGGWQNRDTAYAFARYSEIFAKHFHTRVKNYYTFNEPQCIVGLGHVRLLHAPGRKLSDEDAFVCWHNIILAHALASKKMRAIDPEIKIGVASTGALTYVSNRLSGDLASDSMVNQSAMNRGGSLEDCSAISTDGSMAKQLEKTPQGLADGAFVSLPIEENPGWCFNHQWFLDPIVFGRYPDDPNHPWEKCKNMEFGSAVADDDSFVEGAAKAGAVAEDDSFGEGVAKAGAVAAQNSSSVEEDLKLIASQPIDFIGLNCYNGTEMREVDGKWERVPHYEGYPRTALKWPVTPEILYWGPRLLTERYHIPIVITENGLSCNDKIYLDGKVHDFDRIDFLHRYLRELRAAVDAGIPVLGYFHWAFTDNYEWHSGYDDRFGLIYIDYRTLERIPKDSALWYRKVILTNGENL